jgi:hypothetical protein
MATIADLVDDVRPMIADNIPEITMQGAILWSAREFLRRSRWLRETIPGSVQQDVNTYPLTAVTTDTEVFNLQAAQVGADEVLTPATQEEVMPGSRGWYMFEAPATLILSWTPDADDDGSDLLVRALLNLTTTATSIPDAVLRQWNTAITYGALHRLCMMAKTSWFDAKAAEAYRQLWSADIETARMEAELQSKAYAFGSVR